MKKPKTTVKRKFNKDIESVLIHIVRDYPGLLDGEAEVNGADLVSSISFRIRQYELNKYLKEKSK